MSNNADLGAPSKQTLAALLKAIHCSCPLTARAILARKFSLPKYREADYFNQDDINQLTLMMLMLPSAPEFAPDDVIQGSIFNIFQALRHDRPALFLERELGEILIKTEIPGFLETADIHFLFPSIRVMLPRKLLCLGEQDRSAMYLDIGHLPADTEIGCPKDIAAELDNRFGGEEARLSRMTYHYPKHTLVISAELDQGFASTYAVIKPLQGTLEELKVFRGKLHTDYPNSSDDNKLIESMQRLALNILLILSMTPFEYTPNVIERKERKEGKRIIPSLVRARWVGDCLVRAKREGRIQGELPASGRKILPHWVRAYWRLQRYGKGNTLRKTIWVLPYRTGITSDPDSPGEQPS